MGRVDSMRSLGREIKGSHDERQAVLASIRREVGEDANETQRMMKEKDREHREMAASLRKDLAISKSDLRRQVTDLRNSFRNMINGIKNEHLEVVNAWHDLVSTMQSKRGRVRA